MTTGHDRNTSRNRAAARSGAGWSDLGQTAIVAVAAVSLIIAIIGATLVAAVVQSAPLQQTVAVAVYAHRALQAGENAYLTAVNANPSLAQCNTNTNNAGTCGGINYGQWNLVTGSNSSDSYAEYYAFGNPQPTFDPTTHALSNLSVQVVGAAHSQSATNHYYFNSETMNLAATNGFLTNVWWSNFESYNPNGDYTNCNYNWKIRYNIDGGGTSCSPVYFGPADYLFGPVYTNDSVFTSGDGSVCGSPSFGNPYPPPVVPPCTNPSPGAGVPSDVHTADPNCQFVTDSNGMSGIPLGSTPAQTCASAPGAVNLYANSSNTTSPLPVSTYNHAVEPPPQSNAQLGTIASEDGCLYSGPTQITLTTDASGKGEMTVSSPDTNVTPATVNGQSITRSNDNLSTNNNDCPNDGTAYLPSNGVVYVQNASTADTVTGANPFDDLVNNTVTNLTANSTPQQNNPVTLTATVTSATKEIPSNATVTFSQTTSQTTTQCNWSWSWYWGWQWVCKSVTKKATNPIAACTGLSSWSAPVQVGSFWQASITCTTTESSTGTGAFSAAYSGGQITSASQGNLGQTNTLRPSVSYGANSQTNTGGCSSCYYGEKGTPDAEGDAFVHGNLSGELTIGTANNVIVDGNLNYYDCSGRWTTGQSGATDFCPYNVGGTNDSLGLIANDYVEVNRPIVKGSNNQNSPYYPGQPLPSCGATPGALCDPSTSGRGISIDAAVLALTQSFAVNNHDACGSEGLLNVYGSIQQFARGPVGVFNDQYYCGIPTSGYTKHYTWDPLLDFLSPPSYLVPSTAPWTLTSVNSNGGQHGTSVCPVLTGVYDGTSSPPPITQYCSQATGGLPGYPAITAPSPPTQVYATAGAGGVATVNWTDPSDNGSPILHYDVNPSPACATCTGTEVNGATATSASLGGLAPGVSYVFTVTATNANGTSDPSAPSSSVATPSAPNAPTLVNAVGNINDTVAVSWIDPASPSAPITGYTVTPSPACPACTGLTQSGATATSTTINGLTPGGTYTFTVHASNVNGAGPDSAPSNAVVVPTTPGPPVGVTGTSYASGQSVVTWSVPPLTGGLPITGYRVTSSPGGNICTTTGTTSCTVAGLTNGTAYTFTVTATNVLGTGPASAPSPPATPSTVPGVPAIGTATAGNGSATVTFTAPASNGGTPITGYTVTSSPGGITATCASSPCTVSGLTNGTAYTFKVTATNGSGAGPPSAASNSVTPSGPPGPPRSVAATSNANSQSVVSWTAPANNGGSAITGYTVTSSGGQTCSTPNGTTTSCTVTGLTNGVTYTFTVTATNGLGTGAPSSPVSATPASVPGAPTGATAVGGYTRATVSWTAPVVTGGLPVTGYTVTSSPGGIMCTTTSTRCTVSGLSNGTAYTFTVTATNAVGTGPASSPSAAVTPSNTVPGAPTNVAATSYANAQSVVTWTAAAANGSTISKYTVTSSGGQTCTTTGATTCTVNGLTDGTSYTFAVTATNGLGTGPASSPSAPATPSTVPGAPTGVAATSFGDASSVVSWTAPVSTGGAFITSYTVTSSGGQTCTTTGATSCSVTGLTNGTSYTFTVTATNGSGTGPASSPSAPVTPSSVPSAPTGVTGTNNGASQSVVSWTAPASNGGTPVTGYTVTSSGGQTCTTTGATTCTVTGLTDGTSYTFTVTATNAVGTGPASSPSAPVVPATTPDAPTAVSATTHDNSQSVVSWTAPASDGGTPITGYTATSAPGGLTCTSSSTTCTVTGLTNGTSYTFTVTATNAVGTGPASSPSSPIVPATVPGAPINVVATSFADTRSTVSWYAPVSTGGLPLTSYTITANSGQTCTTANSTTRSCTFLGLTNGTTYTFTVTATNAVGVGPASAPATGIPSTVPDPPTGVTATAGGGTQSVVSWTAPVSNGGAAITHYTVTSSGGQTCTTANGTTTSCTVTGLTTGTLYTFTVTATNGSGTSTASAPSYAVAPARSAGRPGAPTTPVVLATSSATTASASWSAPANDGGSTITGYTVTSSPGGLACTTATTSCTVTGLTTGTTYTFAVTATNGVGTGAASGDSLPLQVGTPAPPTGVRAGGGGNSQSIVTWNPPAADGGSAVTDYTVTSSPGGLRCTTSTTGCTVTGLTNGTSYTFTVTATTTVGAGPASAPSAPVVPSTVPGAPTSVTATSDADSRSVVSWMAPISDGGTAIAGYTVRASPGGATCSTASTMCTVTGLANGTAYAFTVTAVNSVGAGVASVPATATPAARPGAPTSATATSDADSQSVVSWTPPSSDGGTPVTGYTVTASPGTGTCTTASTTCAVTGLVNGTPYTFTVTATNAVGTGPASGATRPAVPAAVAGAPTGATVVTTTSASGAIVTWKAPTTDGGAPITSYEVTETPGGATCYTGSTTCPFTGLTPGSPASFTVTATNAAGTSPASTPTNTITVGAPWAPTAVTATSFADGRSVVSWTAPSIAGGSAVSGYTVSSSPGVATPAACSASLTGSSHQCTFTGLTDGTTYTFTVAAVNASGSSAASAPSAPAVPAAPPGAPTAVVATSDANTQSVVSWTAPTSDGGAAVSGYTVAASPGGLTCTTASTTCTMAGLTNGTPYTFTVTATNGAGAGSASSPSAPAIPATVPDSPIGVTATATSSPTSAAISWTAPGSDGGSAVTGYTVTSSPAVAAPAACSTSLTGASTGCTFTGLATGTGYTFTVSAVNAVGTGPVSATTVPLTTGTAAAPTAVTAVATASSTSADLSWAANAADGGSAVTGYTVTSSPAVAAPAACSTSLSGTSTGCTFTGLAKGTSYTFTVSAVNAVGTGLPSVATAPITVGTPGAPTGVTAVATASSTSVAISWTAPGSDGGSAVTGYTVTSSPAVAAPAACSTSLSGTSTGCTFTGLAKGTSYTFTVSAVNAVGTGLPSVATAPITVGTPGAPTGVTGTSGGGTRSLVSWSSPAADGGSPVTGYTVTAEPGGLGCTGTTTGCGLAGLTPGTAYRFTVTATNATGTGPSSTPSATVTP